LQGGDNTDVSNILTSKFICLRRKLLWSVRTEIVS